MQRERFGSTGSYRLKACEWGECAIRQGEEFRASDKRGTVAKYLSEEERDRVSGVDNARGNFTRG
jgi:hypothetical protein